LGTPINLRCFLVILTPMLPQMELLDWKHRIFALYAQIRASSDPRDAWQRWVATRDDLFATHPQSPVPKAERVNFAGVTYFEYDETARVTGELVTKSAETLEITTSTDETITFDRFASVRFQLHDDEHELDVYWLQNYGGGLFLPFRDTTAGTETYGAGRYLLDTVKGADLGTDPDGRLILDFNFSYNPSCAYDPQWVCPLAPPANRLDVEVKAGERQ
jgi:uncharacterized protein